MNQHLKSARLELDGADSETEEISEEESEAELENEEVSELDDSSDDVSIDIHRNRFYIERKEILCKIMDKIVFEKGDKWVPVLYEHLEYGSEGISSVSWIDQLCSAIYNYAHNMCCRDENLKCRCSIVKDIARMTTGKGGGWNTPLRHKAEDHFGMYYLSSCFGIHVQFEDTVEKMGCGNNACYPRNPDNFPEQLAMINLYPEFSLHYSYIANTTWCAYKASASCGEYWRYKMKWMRDGNQPRRTDFAFKWCTPETIKQLESEPPRSIYDLWDAEKEREEWRRTTFPLLVLAHLHVSESPLHQDVFPREMFLHVLSFTGYVEKQEELFKRRKWAFYSYK